MIDSLVTLIFSLFNLILSNEVYIIKRLGIKYGRDILREVRNLEKTIIKLNKTKCDYEFLQTCLIYNLASKFIRFKLWKTKYQKHHVYHQRQRKHLQMEYDQKSKQCMKLRSEYMTLLELIKQKINPIELQLLNKHLDQLKEKEKLKIKNIHKRKIEKLSKGDIKLDTIDPKKVVYNISSRILTDDEESILSKGLQFCIETKIKDSIEFKTDIELMAFNLLKQLHMPDATSLNFSIQLIHSY
ncbi:unnamed protein product [Rotaria sp. Silwood2]|nr:unnamed protein product [Rotaria sp. Silwood2]